MEKFPANRRYSILNLYDSHDTDRLGSMVANPDTFYYDRGNSPRWMASYNLQKPNLRQRRVQKLMTFFQMTYVGAPLIYYGTEAGMWGADDPDDRKPMLWNDLTYEAEAQDPRNIARDPDEMRFDYDFLTFYQSIIKLRKQHRGLSTGNIRFILANNEAKTFAFSRASASERLYIILNKSEQPQTVNFEVQGQVRRILFSARGEEHQIAFRQNGNQLMVTLPSQMGVILK